MGGDATVRGEAGSQWTFLLVSAARISAPRSAGVEGALRTSVASVARVTLA